MKDLKTRKTLSKLVSDFLRSVYNTLLYKDRWEFTDLKITVDFHKSLLYLESECGFYKFINKFNNNDFPYDYTCGVKEYIGD